MNACTRNCWIAGALAGLAVAAFLLVISHMSLVAALFLGVVTAGLLAALLIWGFCARPTVNFAQSGAVSGTEAPTPPAPAPAAEVPADEATTAEVPAAEAPAAEAPAAVAPAPEDAPVPVEIVTAPKAPEVPAPAVPEPEPVPEADSEAEQQARALRRKARRQRLAAEKARAEAEAGAPAAAVAEAPLKPKPTKAEREARAARRAAGQAQAQAAQRPEGVPELLAAPRGGKADDLKAIKGVGPKFEKLLNAQGVWHYDQIASWGPKDIAAIEAMLEGFSGRIERDGWVAQAKTLAAGGTTEFSRRVAEGDVYKGGE